MLRTITVLGLYNDGHIITPDGMAYHCLLPKNSCPPSGTCIFTIVPEGINYKILKVRPLSAFPECIL